MQQAESTTVLDAALFLYEVHTSGWSQLGPELRSRPETLAFLLRAGAVRRPAGDDLELTLAGRSLVAELVRRAQAQARTDLGRRAAAGRALASLVTEHAGSV